MVIDGAKRKTGQTAYGAAANWAGKTNIANKFTGNDRVSAYDFFGSDSSSDGGGGGGGGGGGRRGGVGVGGGGVGGTARNVSYDISDPLTAKAILNQSLAQQLGRQATKAELAAFTTALNAQEKANPSITTSVSDGAGNTSSSQTGGFSMNAKQQFAQDQAQAKPEYQPYQQATTYFDAFLGAIKSPVSTP
jgi:hypothetical protein